VSVGLKEAEPTARLLNVQLTPIQVRNLDDLDSAFRSGAKNGADAVIIQGSRCFNSNQTKLIQLTARNRMSVM
jgi:hypothetical protein